MLKERTTYEIMNPQRRRLGRHQARARQALRPGGVPQRAARARDPARRRAAQRGLPAVPGAGRPQEDASPPPTWSRSSAISSKRQDDALQLVRWNVEHRPAASRRRRSVVVSSRRRSRSPAMAEGTVRSMRSSRRSTRRLAIACELEDYHVEAVTPGEDAQGQVHVRIRVGRPDLHRARAWRRTSSRRARGPIWRR